MSYRIIPINSPSADSARGWRLNLPETIGRNTELAICIDDESISRAHCQILLGPDEGLLVRDLGSMNGTYVNGERIRQNHSLIPGDILQIGSASFQIEYIADDMPTALTRPKPTTGLKATQPMKSLPPLSAASLVREEITKRWWEIWK